jgi:hypothetical protein
MLRHCALGINVASTISLELCMFDKPCINVNYLPPGFDYYFDYRGYYQYEHYAPIVASGGLTLASNEREMALQIRQHLTQPQAHSANRKQLLKDFFRGDLDGHVSDRLAKCLVQLTQRHAS